MSIDTSTVSTTQLRLRLREILDLVGEGHRFTIEIHGWPVATLGPLDSEQIIAQGTKAFFADLAAKRKVKPEEGRKEPVSAAQRKLMITKYGKDSPMVTALDD